MTDSGLMHLSKTVLPCSTYAVRGTLFLGIECHLLAGAVLQD